MRLCANLIGLVITKRPLIDREDYRKKIFYPQSRLPSLIVLMIKPILAQYIPVADMIVSTFGNDVEVVLHDLSTPQHSVVYVVNNAVTGRQVGESFQHLLSKVIRATDDPGDVVPNFYYRHEGRLIRSSSILIRDPQGHLVGALCINVDTTRITTMMKTLSAMLPGIDTAALPQVPDVLHDDVCPMQSNRTVLEIMTELVDHIVGEEPDLQMTRERRLELIRFMDQKGVFLVKGAVERVADKLGISKVTVYSYLDEVRGKR